MTQKENIDTEGNHGHRRKHRHRRKTLTQKENTDTKVQEKQGDSGALH